MLTAGILIVYTALVAGLGQLVGGSGPTWFLVAATGVIALALEPGRQRVRRLVDRLVYGSRDDPLALVQRIVDHVGTGGGDDLLPSVVRSLERELRLEPVAIDLPTPDGWQRGGIERAVHTAPSRGRAASRRRGGRPPRRRLGARALAATAGRARAQPDHGAADAGRAVGAPGRVSCGARTSPSSSPARRSGGACAGTSTTASVRRSRASRSDCAPPCAGSAASATPATCDRHSNCWSASPTRWTTSSTSSSRSSAGCAPLPSTSSACSAPCAEFTRQVRRRPAVPPGAAERPAAVARRGRGGDVPHRDRGRDERRAPRPGRAMLADDRRRTGRSTSTSSTTAWGSTTRAADGVGLAAMRERAAELGGRVQLRPMSPHGTHLHVELPAALA